MNTQAKPKSPSQDPIQLSSSASRPLILPILLGGRALLLLHLEVHCLGVGAVRLVGVGIRVHGGSVVPGRVVVLVPLRAGVSWEVVQSLERIRLPAAGPARSCTRLRTGWARGGRADQRWLEGWREELSARPWRVSAEERQE